MSSILQNSASRTLLYLEGILLAKQEGHTRLNRVVYAITFFKDRKKPLQFRKAFNKFWKDWDAKFLSSGYSRLK